MKIILLQDYEKLGKAYDQVEVKDGYARNFLIPKGIAIRATKNNIRMIEEKLNLQKRREEKKLKQAQALAEKLKKLSITIPVQVGEEDKVYGSVTSQEIAVSLKEKGFEIDKRQILLEEPIKALGIYDVPIKLHPEVTGYVKLWVIKS
ncbi:MAG: 50S ribosomal protein L9 [Candidatus Marinimicrobia bacterium]|nr:50S ribosomal protein L9 [Candidatus Neomarinimicrobiota bacterium]RKY49261.1 MAG: 50S ribosomal protein L9 [Candidatus Neomarinimicrobiota bacterium]HDN59325.1 50S ribosomal protein L9 [Candidatus Neomarinimicrobiota bacterium]